MFKHKELYLHRQRLIIRLPIESYEELRHKVMGEFYSILVYLDKSDKYPTNFGALNEAHVVLKDITYGTTLNLIRVNPSNTFNGWRTRTIHDFGRGLNG